MKLTRWVEEHLGWKINLRFFSRKVWKAYLLHVCPSLVMLFGGGGITPTAPPVQARPQEVKPHVSSLNKSNHVTLEGRYILEVAMTSASVSHTFYEVASSFPRRSQIQPAPKPTDQPSQVKTEPPETSGSRSA